MKPLKTASLSSSLLVLKGRTNPAALVDQILSELNSNRGPAQSAPVERMEPQRPSRPRERAEPAVIVPWQNAAAVRRPVLESMSRKKLSLRLDRVRHFRMKLTAYHLGISAQELMTRALDSYIENVAPEIATTKPLPSTGLRPLTVDAGAQIRQAAPVDMTDERPTIGSE